MRSTRRITPERSCNGRNQHCSDGEGCRVEYEWDGRRRGKQRRPQRRADERVGGPLRCLQSAVGGVQSVCRNDVGKQSLRCSVEEGLGRTEKKGDHVDHSEVDVAYEEHDPEHTDDGRPAPIDRNHHPTPVQPVYKSSRR